MQSVRSRHHFNPRSHERSDVSLVVTSIESAISIHAPTRGATGKLQFLYMELFISIHAPTRGATNTRTVVIVVLDISIHAPTRGATVFHFHYPLILSISIHAPTRGATSALCVLLYPPEFQSTLPREERPHSSSLTSQLHNFNPRSHERSD